MPTDAELRAALAVLNALGIRLSVLDAEALAYLDYQRRKLEVGHVAAFEEVMEAHPRVAERRGHFAQIITDTDYRRVRTRANRINDRIKIDPVLPDDD